MALDHERLDVDPLSIEFIAWAGELLDGSLKKSGWSAAKHLEDARIEVFQSSSPKPSTRPSTSTTR